MYRKWSSLSVLSRSEWFKSKKIGCETKTKAKKGVFWHVRIVASTALKKIFFASYYWRWKMVTLRQIPNTGNHDVGVESNKLQQQSHMHRSKVMLYIWWGEKGVVYYELLKSGESITRHFYREQLAQLSRKLKEKQQEYGKRHDKVILRCQGNSRAARMGCSTHSHQT